MRWSEVSHRSWLGLFTWVVAAALLPAACVQGTGAPGRDGIAGTSRTDVNPREPASLRNGGELRLAADQLPDNWNYHQLDGPTGEGFKMISTVMPTMWAQTAEGSARINTDYLRSAELTSRNPQVVTYRLNPRARWSNGQRLSFRDLKAQAEALSGRHHDYEVASTSGYQDIATVQAGSGPQVVKVTFRRRFAEWQTLFSPLYPASMYASAKEFNSGWLHAPRVTAGPFKIGRIDEAARTVTMVRDPAWWGAVPRLDKITFKVVDKAALADSMAEGKLDAYTIGSNAELFARSKQVKGAVIRQASGTDYSTLCFNGAPGRVLSDQALRIAVQKGIDAGAIARSVLGSMDPHPRALGNHLFLPGSRSYRDNSAVVRFDQEVARRQLDALGWTLDGAVRTKGGRQLAIRFVIGAGSPLSERVSQAVRAQLAEIGVRIDIQRVPPADYFRSYVNVGNFDISTFRWLVTAFPVTNFRGVATLDPHNVNENYGRIGNPTINRLFDRATAELDGDKRAELAQQIDEEIWKSGSQLPLFQSAGAVAVRDTVANYGAAGYASLPYDWLAVGFTR
jgi:peptide/nickel transport system substrate-binding protein